MTTPVLQLQLQTRIAGDYGKRFIQIELARDLPYSDVVELKRYSGQYDAFFLR
jgi:hypothetical protein